MKRAGPQAFNIFFKFNISIQSMLQYIHNKSKMCLSFTMLSDFVKINQKYLHLF